MKSENMLVISGLEPTGRSGLLLDVRVARHYELSPVALATCTTSQFKKSFWVNPESPEKLAQAIQNSLPYVKSIKIGLVPTPDVANAIADVISAHKANIKAIYDPVLVSSSGYPLFWGGAYDSLFVLIQEVDLITPNFIEAKMLANINSENPENLCDALIERGAKSVLLKGGHLKEKGVDYLHDGEKLTRIEPEKILDFSIRGSGCLISTAIAAEFAKGKKLSDAVVSAKKFFESAAQKVIELFGEYAFDIR